MHLCKCFPVMTTILVILGLVLRTPAYAAESSGFELAYPKQRQQAPGFELSDLAAGTVSLDSYGGKVMLIHFWATFCAPCIKEMPELEVLWQEYREQGLVVMGIATDRGSAGVVREYVKKTAVSFPVLLDQEGEVRNQYEVFALPMSYLIGRDGKISARAIGSQDWNSQAGRAVIESLLGMHPIE